MSGKFRLTCILILFLQTETKCPVEFSTVLNSTAKVKWSSRSLINEIIISVPPCMKNHSLVTRICSGSVWYPKESPQCESITKKCPFGYQKIEDFCVEINFGPFFSKQNLLPVRRMVKYGNFENRAVSTDYGETFPLSLHIKDLYKGDCLIREGNSAELKIENCTNLANMSKYFPIISPVFDCPLKNCKSARDFKCFCKSEHCDVLATIRNVADKKIIQQLVEEDVCNVKNSVISRKSWHYSEAQVSCSICEVEARSFLIPKLVLTFQETKRELYLLVYSPQVVKKADGEFLVFCFTNADQYELKEKVKIELVYENFSTKTPLLVYKIKIEKYLGEYWCEAFSTTFTLIPSNRILAFKKKRGNEYSLRFIFENPCKIYSCDFQVLFPSLIGILKQRLKGSNPEVRIMEVFDFDLYTDSIDILVHISTGKNKDVWHEYHDLKTILLGLNLKMVYFRSSEFCLPEKTILTWPLTKINEAAIPEEFCLLEDGTPVVRHCQGGFLYGGIWYNKTDTCQRSNVSKITEKLRDISRNGSRILDFWNIIKTQNFTLLDIHYLKVIIQKSTNDLFLLEAVEKLLTTERNLLEKGQKLLNLTDLILKITDEVLENLTFSENAVLVERKENIIFFVTNPFTTNVTGLAIYGSKKSSFKELEIKEMKTGETFEDLIKTNLQLAVYIPELVLNQLANETTNISVEILIFQNDHFFIDDTFNSRSFVLEVTIPGFGSYLQTPIPILFSSETPQEKKCGFWDFGQKTNLKKGSWSFLGSESADLQETNLHYCSFVHLTHFALLLMSDKKNVVNEDDDIIIEDQDTDSYFLEVITIVGCSLSVFGIFGIFTTAILFQKWSRKTGTKLLLNLAVAILLEILCINLTEIRNLKKSEELCKTIGMILHYVVLSKFFWMLVYAWLQYSRFVKVLGIPPKNLILKAMIFAWGIPLIFVFLVGLLTRQSYVSVSYQLCYPRGILLYLSVIAPIALILIANITIYCLVMYNVSYTNQKLFKQKLYLGFLLFSVLGIPWFFGILAELLALSFFKILLFYVFCVTGTLQGFILFLFYVVLNHETREFWKKKFSYL